MATNDEVEAAYKAADDMLEIDGVRVHPADKDRFLAARKAQKEAEEAVAAPPKARKETANKSRSNTDADNK